MEIKKDKDQRKQAELARAPIKKTLSPKSYSPAGTTSILFRKHPNQSKFNLVVFHCIFDSTNSKTIDQVDEPVETTPTEEKKEIEAKPEQTTDDNYTDVANLAPPERHTQDTRHSTNYSHSQHNNHYPNRQSNYTCTSLSVGLLQLCLLLFLS